MSGKYHIAQLLLQNINITRVNPDMIPKSGNRVITITGENLDISNMSLATVELAEIPCRIMYVNCITFILY